MKLLAAYEIDSNGFQKLDDRVTAADSYLDVATMQKARKNHNVLLARRVRRNIFNHIPVAGWNVYCDSVFTTTPYTHSIRPPIYMTGSFMVTQRTQKVQFSFYAREEIGGIAHPQLGIKFWQPGKLTPVGRLISDADLATVTINNAAYAWFTVEVELPHSIISNPTLIGGYAHVNFMVMAQCVIDAASPVFAGAAITDSGPNWVRTTGAGFFGVQYYCAYTDSTNQQPGVITGVVNYAAADRKIYVDPPFTNAVDVTSTLSVAPINGIRIKSMHVAELATTSLLASVGRLV